MRGHATEHETAEFVVRRLLERADAPEERPEVSWVRAGDGAQVKVRGEEFTFSEIPRFDLVVGFPNETLDQLNARAPWDSPWTGQAGLQLKLTADGIISEAPLDPHSARHVLPVFERAAEEVGTARDPRQFAAIAADHFVSRGAALTHGATSRSVSKALDVASYETTRPGAVSEFVSTLPRGLRTILDLSRADDAELVRRAADVSVHRIAPERQALDRFTVVPERGVDRWSGPGR